jgi:hypothetical protein
MRLSKAILCLRSREKESSHTEPAELLRDALALPLEARSALIDSLIETVDATVNEGAAAVWKSLR